MPGAFTPNWTEFQYIRGYVSQKPSNSGEHLGALRKFPGNKSRKKAFLQEMYLN